MSEICVQKVNELSGYGMIWTDEYGFLLKPLGMSSSWQLSSGYMLLDLKDRQLREKITISFYI